MITQKHSQLSNLNWTIQYIYLQHICLYKHHNHNYLSITVVMSLAVIFVLSMFIVATLPYNINHSAHPAPPGKISSVILQE